MGPYRQFLYNCIPARYLCALKRQPDHDTHVSLSPLGFWTGRLKNRASAACQCVAQGIALGWVRLEGQDAHGFGLVKVPEAGAVGVERLVVMLDEGLADLLVLWLHLAHTTAGNGCKHGRSSVAQTRPLVSRSANDPRGPPAPLEILKSSTAQGLLAHASSPAAGAPSAASRLEQVLQIPHSVADPTRLLVPRFPEPRRARRDDSAEEHRKEHGIEDSRRQFSARALGVPPGAQGRGGLAERPGAYLSPPEAQRPRTVRARRRQLAVADTPKSARRDRPQLKG